MRSIDEIRIWCWFEMAGINWRWDAREYARCRLEWRGVGGWESTTGAARGFDFIECFTTIFLRAHSWLNWVVELHVETGWRLWYWMMSRGAVGGDVCDRIGVAAPDVEWLERVVRGAEPDSVERVKAVWEQMGWETRIDTHTAMT